MTGKKICCFIVLFSALVLLWFTYDCIGTREEVTHTHMDPQESFACDYIDSGEWVALDSIDPQEKENSYKRAVADAVCSTLSLYAYVSDVIVDTNASPVLFTIMSSDAFSQVQKKHIEEYVFAAFPESEIEYQVVTDGNINLYP